MTKFVCSACGAEFEAECPECGKWLCGKCGTVNSIGGDQGEGENWLACIEFEGEEAILPSGYQIRSPGLTMLDFVAAYEVLDRGQIKMINPWETAQDNIPGKILAVIMNEAAVQKVQATYDGRGIVVSDVNGARLTVNEWREKYHTDPLAQLAISRACLATTGPGVQTYRPAGTKFGVDATKIAGAGQGRTNLGNRQPVKLGKY